MLRSRLPAAFAGLLIAVLSLVQAAPAQAVGLPPGLSAPDVDPNYEPALTFDIATIRPMERNQWRGVTFDSPLHASHLLVAGIPLHSLIGLAFRPASGPIQVVGGPDWLESDFYTIEAKSDHSIDDQLAKLSDSDAHMEKIHMLQALLMDRFHLKFHMETREGRVDDLVLTKAGPKLHPSPVPQADPGQPAPIVGALGPHIALTRDRHGRIFDCQRFSTIALASMLSGFVDTPVLDKTGLNGSYDFTLSFASQDSAASDPEAYPTLFIALQEQLGLKLDASKGPVDTLVIDHVDRPTEN